VKDENKAYRTVTLHRVVPDVVKGVRTLKRSVLPDGPPSRVPSTLPSPGNLQLTISVESVVGDGRCGTVFSTRLHPIADPLSHSAKIPEPGSPYLPSLVIKVADQAHIADLASEASMYEEMESLQGIAVPRCYGWFEAELETTWIVASNFGETQISTPTPRPHRLSLLLLERMGGLLPLGERLPDRYVEHPF
jgi:hypothetical protein